ncbi:MAG: hypothetical protein NT126_10375 [Bacteroidetes bacterium]|nr:hypothetical protein [Bacteroidota bacterium]
MLYKQFYSELGKLLYAVADVDGVITQEEKSALKKLIRKELVPVEKSTDEFGTDAAFYAEFEFDILEDAKASPQAAFNSFITFVENHHSAFDHRLRNATLKIVNELAEAFHKNSENEKVLIEKLKAKLEALPVREKKLKIEN